MSEFNRLGAQGLVESRCIWAEHLQHSVNVLYGDHGICTSVQKIAFGVPSLVSGVLHRLVSGHVETRDTAQNRR
jgi:hypothetical protein